MKGSARHERNLPTKQDLDQAREWLRSTNPLEYRSWELGHQFADYLADERDVEKQLVRDWSTAQEPGQHPEVACEEAGIKFDSAERRQGLAASLDGVSDREAVEAQLSSDQDQGTPPSAALARASGKNAQGTQAVRHQRLVETLAKGHEPIALQMNRAVSIFG